MANEQLNQVIKALIECFRTGHKLLVCGNGGSASDSAHIVGEFVKGFLKKRPLPEDWQTEIGTDKLQTGLPAIDLTAQGAVIAAIVNDQEGRLMFAQQVIAYAQPGDMLIGISTSGNSENVILAMRAAKVKGATRVALTGKGGGKLANECDLLVESGETETYKVQEEHIRLYHELCIRVEEAFFEK